MTSAISPDSLFEAIVHSLEAAVISKDLNGTVLTWNPAAEAIFGWSAEEMIGQSIRRLIPPDRQQEEDTIISLIRNGDGSVRMETERLRKDGTSVSIAVLVSPLRDKAGTIIGATKIARDISSELHTREALSDIEQRFSLMADNISQLAWIADASGWIFWYNRRWFEFTGTAIEDMQGWGWQAVHHPDHVDRVTEHIAKCFASGEEWEDTFPLRGADGTYRWFLSRAVPLRDSAGNVRYWFGTNTDVTEQRDTERRIELLMMEVNHRSKNLLTVVQSLARRTSGASPEEFVRKLDQRLAGLAANQDVLVQRNWTKVPLRDLIEAQLAFLGDARAQVDLNGPHLIVLPATAEAISMAIHELATNAVKYGALSEVAGRIAISWTVAGSGKDARFTLAWRESGGPPARPPERRGFGSRIIEEVPRGRLRAEVSIEYPPEGCRFELNCPAENVIAAD